MTIGITGANGFLGLYLSDFLTNAGHDVLAMDLSATHMQYHVGKGRRIHVGNLQSRKECDTLVEKTDLIIHLAHSSTPLSTCTNVAQDLIENLTPSLNLIESIKQSGKDVRLLYASSGGTVYGKQTRHIPFSETDACSPACSYGIQKYTIEKYISCYSHMGDLCSTIFRISNPYGVLLPSSRKQGLIGVVLNRIKNGEPIQIYGDPENVRDYIHLDDFCRAILSCIETQCNGVYNIGSGHGVSVNKVLGIIESCLGAEIKREYVSNEQTKNLCEWAILDISKAECELGWKPQIEFRQGLEAMCHELSQNKSSPLG